MEKYTRYAFIRFNSSPERRAKFEVFIQQYAVALLSKLVLDVETVLGPQISLL
jgi:hypothetical protein